MKIVFGGRKWTVAGRFSRPERGADGDRHRPPMDEPPLRETAGEREEVLDPVQFAEGTGHEELHVVEVLAVSCFGQRDHVEREESAPRGERNRRHVAHEGEDGIEVDPAADRLALKPVGRSQPVSPALTFLLDPAIPRVFGLGEVLHLGGDHPLHLLRRREALIRFPVLAHVYFLSVAFATAHMMP